MIELAWFSGSDLMLHGFKSKNLIVWNETQQYEVSSVGGGGAHRSYAYSPIAGAGGAGHLVYTKASKLYLHTQRQPSHQIVKPGGHGREIKACAVSPNGLIATGAEDTAIRIWGYQSSKSTVEKRFQCLAVAQKHTTGIQCLQWHGSSYLFSSGGNEEFYIWAVESIPGLGVGLVCEASCPDQSEEKDLRIMNLDVSSWTASSNGLEILVISLAYSDSTIRCYTYSKRQGFGLIATGQYTSSCLTQLRHLKIGPDLFFLTAGTDGHLTIWKCAISNRSKGSSSPVYSQTSKPMMLSNHRLHQSTVKSLDVFRTANGIMIASGGDDNALGVTIYQANDLAGKPRSILVRSAHVAAITGLSFVAKSTLKNKDELRIITSSNDQRVKEWVLSTCGELPEFAQQMKIRKVGDAFTSVADIGDLTGLITPGEDTSRIVVVGNGMEVYEVTS